MGFVTEVEHSIAFVETMVIYPGMTEEFKQHLERVVQAAKIWVEEQYAEDEGRI